MEDRISELPEHILQNHIISLLPQNVAVRTRVLSKSWRHFGPTGPKIKFDESWFYRGSKDDFISVVENTLQRYVDQNLSLQEFILRMSYSGSKNISFPLLIKWIPIVMNMGVKTFKLTAYDFPLPSLVFESEILEELFLYYCKLELVKNCVVKLHMLKRLDLFHVHIEDKTFEKIMSSCPFIQHLFLDSCKGLSAVKVNKARNLKHFVFNCCAFRAIDSIEINDDAPSLETIRITSCRNLSHMHNNNFFPALKSLYLWGVHLPSESLNNLSPNNCPCLEKLELHHCSGFTEINLSNLSIMGLIIHTNNYHPINSVNIDVANILYFEFKSGYLPSTISFKTTSREWESHIEVSRSDADDFSTWYLKLYELLKAISQSQISLNISELRLWNQDTYDGDSCEHVVVEHLCLSGDYSSYQVQALLNCLFRICRPRYIELPFYCDSKVFCEGQLGEFVWKTLKRQHDLEKLNFKNRNKRQQDLEKLNFKNRNKRHPVKIVQCQTTWKLLLVFFPLCFFILCCWFKLTYVRIEIDNHLVEL